jgi:PEP-CTERM motif
MKFSIRALSMISGMSTLLAVAGTAYADPVATGAVWQNASFYPNPLPANSSGLGAPAATFDVNGFNFNSNGSTDYKIGSFLTSGGNTVSNGSGLSGISGNTLNNTVFEFKGSTNLIAGQTYEVTHDDGAILYLDGSSTNVLGANSGNPTVADESTFTVGTTGLYSFDLLYAEVNGAPAVLTSDMTLASAATPEPSSFILLGSGLLAAVGVVRRRLTA